MKCHALPSFLIVMLGVALVASFTSATSPSKAAQPLRALSRHGWLLGTRRKVTQSSPLRSGSKASAVAVQATGASYRGTSSTLVGTAGAGGKGSGPCDVSSGLELQFASASAKSALSKPRPMDTMDPRVKRVIRRVKAALCERPAKDRCDGLLSKRNAPPKAEPLRAGLDDHQQIQGRGASAEERSASLCGV